MNDVIYSSLILGLRDYVEKNNFPGVVLGISGGIDSAFSAAVATDALGPSRVKGILMPSKYTSIESNTDASELGNNLGIELMNISINDIVNSYDNTLNDLFSGTEKDITEENIQSRTRGAILMAYSNKFGHMVITNGNKSEVSVGYSTLYGDMCGGFSVVKDIYKTDLFKLSEWRNKNKPSLSLLDKNEIIPNNIITKEPTAELKEDQKDSDSLPPYDVLDKVLYHLVEKESSVKEIVDQGFDKELVKRIQNLLYNSEYKRRQAAPGVKISERNFGYDRRYPITNAFRDMEN
jgi:NAD+ synthase